MCNNHHAVLSASARAGSPHREFNKYFGAPKTQPDVELRRGSGSIEIKQILSATSRETLFSGTACPGLVIAPVYYYRRLLSPTSDTHIGLLQCHPRFKNLSSGCKSLELCADVASDVGIKAKSRLPIEVLVARFLYLGWHCIPPLLSKRHKLAPSGSPAGAVLIPRLVPRP